MRDRSRRPVIGGLLARSGSPRPEITGLPGCLRAPVRESGTFRLSEKRASGNQGPSWWRVQKTEAFSLTCPKNQGFPASVAAHGAEGRHFQDSSTSEHRKPAYSRTRRCLVAGRPPIPGRTDPLGRGGAASHHTYLHLHSRDTKCAPLLCPSKLKHPTFRVPRGSVRPSKPIFQP